MRWRKWILESFGQEAGGRSICARVNLMYEDKFLAFLDDMLSARVVILSDGKDGRLRGDCGSRNESCG